MPPFSILMFIFSGLLLLYALITAVTKSTAMLPYRYRRAAKMPDKKAYMTGVARTLALVGVVPALSGLAFLWNGLAAAVVFVLGLIAALWLGVRLMRNQIE